MSYGDPSGISRLPLWPDTTPTPNPPAPTPPTPNPPAPTPPTPNPTTPGIDPNELRNATYGKKIPISALGLARIGGNIIFALDPSNNTRSFGISFGMPADPTGTRQLREIAFDSKVAWTLGGGFTGEPFTFRFYQGRQDQPADPLEIAAFPNEPVAYRPQMLLFFENLPLGPFDNKIPYVAAVIGDTTGGANPADGINLGQAIERIAWSPWTGYSTNTFEAIGITDIIGGILLADDYTLVQLCQYISRIYRNFDLLQTDKLRIRDHGALTSPDVRLTRDQILTSDNPVQFQLQEPSATTRELELVTIDSDADYVWVPAKAQRPRNPVATSASYGKETITLPLIMNAQTRIAMVYYAQYAEEAARKKVSVSVLVYGLQIEPGDRIGLMELGEGFENEVFKVTQTTHGANYVVQCEAESILRCNIVTEASATPASCSYAVGSNVNTGLAAATHTFTSIGFGDDSANRVTAIGINARMAATGQTITSVLINGISATQAVAASNAGQGLISAIWYAVNPIGAVGEVVITTSGNMVDLAIGAYRIVTASPVPSDSDNMQATTAGAVSISIDVPVDGFVIAAGATRAGATFSWAGASSNCSVENIPFVTGKRSTASYSASNETAHAISIDPNSTDRVTIAAAAWSLTG